MSVEIDDWLRSSRDGKWHHVLIVSGDTYVDGTRVRPLSFFEWLKWRVFAYELPELPFYLDLKIIKRKQR